MNLMEQYEILLNNAEILFMAYRGIIKQKECYIEGQRVIGICKDWIANNEISADDIYETIDSEECYDIAEFSGFKGITEEEAYMWILLTDIVCALCSLAYQIEEQKYVPQVIECIIEDEIENFTIFLNKNMKVHENIKECAEYFAKNVCY